MSLEWLFLFTHFNIDDCTLLYTPHTVTQTAQIHQFSSNGTEQKMQAKHIQFIQLCNILKSINRSNHQSIINRSFTWNTTHSSHTHPFNGTLSRTTWVSRYQKGKTNLDFTEARDSEWQWHQLGHMQVCNSLQTDNHANISPLSFFTGRMPFLPPYQQRQSTIGIVNSTDKCRTHKWYF